VRRKNPRKSRKSRWFQTRHQYGLAAAIELLKGLLAETGGNVRRASALLGKCRKDVEDLIDKHGLKGYVQEQRRLLADRKTQSKSWIEQTQKELCDGTADSNDGDGVPGDGG